MFVLQILLKERKDTMARGWEENESEYNDWEKPMSVGRSLWGWLPVKTRWPEPGFWKQYDYQPWIAVAIVLMVLPWTVNCLPGVFLFISGDFVTDSLIGSAVIATAELIVYLRKRSYNNIAREIEQEYEASRNKNR